MPGSVPGDWRNGFPAREGVRAAAARASPAPRGQGPGRCACGLVAGRGRWAGRLSGGAAEIPRVPEDAEPMGRDGRHPAAAARIPSLPWCAQPVGRDWCHAAAAARCHPGHVGRRAAAHATASDTVAEGAPPTTGHAAEHEPV